MDAATDALIAVLMERGLVDQDDLARVADRLERAGHKARAHEVRSIPFGPLAEDAAEPPPLRSVP